MEKRPLSEQEMDPEGMIQALSHSGFEDGSLVFRLGIIEDTATELPSRGISRLRSDTQDYLVELGVAEHIIEEDNFELRLTGMGRRVLEYCRADTPNFILQSERRRRERTRQEHEKWADGRP